MVAPNNSSLSRRKAIDRLADQFECEFKVGEHPRIEDYVEQYPFARREILAELLALEVELRRTAGEQPNADEYRKRFQNDGELVAAVFGVSDSARSTIEQPLDRSLADEGTMPAAIGRYEIRRILGRGGFGVVYLAHDPYLDRPVALKVPRRKRFNASEHVAQFIEEARAVANLRHASLVVVHDVQEHDGLPYIVQEYIEGQNLGAWSAAKRPSFDEIARVLVGVAEALGYAHQHGLTHCDLKPANVLMDTSGQPHVADFGLAVHESVQALRKGEVFGTPSMMAPEQVRGESHRLDGRTDIWAIGVMLYELLVGRKPFTAASREELYAEIQHHDPKPPRQINRQVPRELERICLKCLSKRRTDRYNTTDDLREDLQAWLNGEPSTDSPQSRTVATAIPPDSSSGSKPPVKILPKGLRSFDAEDADFFLELLPGPRDRDGVPDSVRFWRIRIEETDPDNTFSVGLMYGPSGCGKSSLVKAGLLPRLVEDILPIYVEATASDTEVRILKQLGRHFSRLNAGHDSLPDVFAELRLTGAGRDRKVLLVLDQFEQWLHAHGGEDSSQLIDALRHCDGRHLQCIVMVRDDFWMAATRFMRALEVQLVEAVNSAAVDLFDQDHARRVLAAFGRAYGRLGEVLTADENTFLEQSVKGLAQDGKVVCVRLSLFADMMKGRPWTPAALQQVGGTEGVGVTFLEETFSASTAPPEHRLHQKAARSVLKALLPEAGTDIRGHMRSYESLLEASGYAARPQEFVELVRILNSEVRLVTPTDPEGSLREDERIVKEEVISENRQESTSTSDTLGPSYFALHSSRYYQLTHDYLVPSLREWLTSKQKETFRGRAKLRLEERAALWHAKPQNRHLPAWWEDLDIRLLTRQREWTAPQRAMMRRSLRRCATWTITVAIVISSLLLLFRYTGQVAEKRRLDGMVAQMWTSELSHLPELLHRLEPYRDVWGRQVAKVALDPSRDSTERTRAHLALAADTQHSLDYLVERLLRVSRTEHQLILDVLRARRADLLPVLVDRVQRPETSASELIRAASALALLVSSTDVSHSRVLGNISTRLIDALVRSDPIEAARWCDTLVTQHHHLIGPLLAAFQNDSLEASQRYLMTSLIADIAQVSPECLSDADFAAVVMASSRNEYLILLPAIRARAATILPYFAKQLVRDVGLETTPENEQLIAQQAIAAETLQRLGNPDDERRFVDLLGHAADPRLRTRLIDCLIEIFKVDGLLERIKSEKRPLVRQSLILGLAKGDTLLSADQHAAVVDELAQLVFSDPHGGVHAAAEWLLRLRGQNEMIAKLRKQAREDDSNDSTWFINSEGQTMIRLEAPGEFVVGSPPWESGRDVNETVRSVRIDYPFAISAHEVTVHQFTRFAPDYQYPKSVCPDPDCPITGVLWSDAMEYCRWLTRQEADAKAVQEQNPPETRRIGNATDPFSAHVDGPAFEYSLPTPEEWEFAARAGSLTSRFFGDEPERLAAYAWCAVNAEERTHRIAELRPNPLGLFDVYGNASEWCLPMTTSDNSMPARGGHYRATPKFLRSAGQVTYDGHAKISLVGLRVVRRPVGSVQLGSPTNK